MEGFYQLYPTGVLEAVLIGLERDFDAACAGDAYRQPKDWISRRISVISKIIGDREATRQRTAHERLVDSMVSGKATKVSRKWPVK
jgi:hypothetical protein